MSAFLSTEASAELLATARQAALNAYVPYSDFPVGAALLTEAGEIVTGVNVENASYGLTLCAERSAISKAITEGKRQFKAIAVWAERRPNGSVTPCGACRQVLSEFLAADSPIIMADATSGEAMAVTMSQLLPGAFVFTAPAQ